LIAFAKWSADQWACVLTPPKVLQYVTQL
jgi:hypothetical protein